MKKLFIVILLIPMLPSCHESLEDRCAREAKKYTDRYYPTPVVNDTRADSVTFQKDTKTHTCHCSLVGELDDAQIVAQNRDRIHQFVMKEIKDNIGIKKLKEAKYNFAYIVHLDKEPQRILYQQTTCTEDYQ